MTGSAITTAALGAEGALCLAGVAAGAVYVRRFVAGPAARARALDGTGAPRLQPWPGNLSDFFLFLLVLFALVSLAAQAAGMLTRLFKAGPDASNLAGGCVLDLGILAGAGLFRLIPRGGRLLLRSAPDPGPATTTASAPGPRSSPPAGARSVLASGCVTFLIAQPLVWAVSLGWEWFLSAAHLPDKEQPMVNLFEQPGHAAIKASIACVAVLLAPVAEEHLFRGGFFRFMRNRTPRPVALLAPALLFALLHQNLSSFLPLVVLAVVFSLAYERTGSLGTTIVAHALFNLNTLALLAAGVNS